MLIHLLESIKKQPESCEERKRARRLSSGSVLIDESYNHYPFAFAEVVLEFPVSRLAIGHPVSDSSVGFADLMFRMPVHNAVKCVCLELVRLPDLSRKSRVLEMPDDFKSLFFVDRFLEL